MLCSNQTAKIAPAKKRKETTQVGEIERPVEHMHSHINPVQTSQQSFHSSLMYHLKHDEDIKKPVSLNLYLWPHQQ